MMDDTGDIADHRFTSLYKPIQGYTSLSPKKNGAQPLILTSAGAFLRIPATCHKPGGRDYDDDDD
jgi:hypothetical protein